MTDTLRELLHASVADADMPQAGGVAWSRAVRLRRRRRSAAVAVVAAASAVAVVAGASLLGGRQTSEPASRPDGTYHGMPVWWAPSLVREAGLPALPASPLPSSVDLSAPAPDLASHPIPRAVAAYAVDSGSGGPRVVVVGPSGQLRSVDLGHVKAMKDPEGNRRVDARSAMLSPSGSYLMFPQDLGIQLLRISNAHWRWLYTIPGLSTWDAQWDGPHSILVPSGDRYSYSIRKSHRPNSWSMVGGFTLPPHRGSQPYGPVRSGDGGNAQSFYPGTDLPQPPRLHLSPAQSDWIGVFDGHDEALVVPAETGRQKACCEAKAWLGRSTLAYESRSSAGLRLLAWQVGSHRFWRVTSVVGWKPGHQTVFSSYADADLGPVSGSP